MTINSTYMSYLVKCRERKSRMVVARSGVEEDGEVNGMYRFSFTRVLETECTKMCMYLTTEPYV